MYNPVQIRNRTIFPFLSENCIKGTNTRSFAIPKFRHIKELLGKPHWEPKYVLQHCNFRLIYNPLRTRNRTSFQFLSDNCARQTNTRSFTIPECRHVKELLRKPPLGAKVHISTFVINVPVDTRRKNNVITLLQRYYNIIFCVVCPLWYNPERIS